MRYLLEHCSISIGINTRIQPLRTLPTGPLEFSVIPLKSFLLQKLLINHFRHIHRHCLRNADKPPG